MLVAFYILILVGLVLFLVSLLMETDENIKSTLKAQAYSCIGSLAIETTSLIFRFIMAKYWVPVFILLIIHSIISIGIFRDAKYYGVFEKKKKEKKNVNVDVLV